jgi:hypothetical protein
LPKTQVFVVDVRTGRATPILHGATDPYLQLLGWRDDGSALRLLRADRYQTRLDLLVADARSGKVRVLLTERQPVSLLGVNMLEGYTQALLDRRSSRSCPTTRSSGPATAVDSGTCTTTRRTARCAGR